MSDDESFDEIQRGRNLSPPPRPPPLQSTSRGNYQLRPVTKIAKVSGKQSPYMLWLNEQGRKLFFQKYRTHYNTHNHEHQAWIGKFWDAMSDEEKQRYKDEAKAYNSNKEEVTKRRHAANKWRRTHNHNHANAFFEQRVDHCLELERRQQYSRDVNGMQKIPERETTWSRLPIFDTDILQRRRLNREHLKNVITFRTLGTTENPFITNQKRNNYFQIISVFPITFLCKTKFSEVFTYPAEIAITTASFSEGIVDCKSIQVEFNAQLFYGDNSEDFDLDKETRSAYCKCLGIPMNGPIHGMKPDEAHEWVINNINQNYFQLCDYKQYTWVTQGLRTLAIITGFAAQRDFAETIAKRLMTIQGFTKELLKIVPLSVRENERMTEDEIEGSFLNNCLLPKSSNHFCNFHKRFDSSDMSKYQCCVSHNARLLHTLFDICDENGLQGFRSIYSRNIHELCNEQDEQVASLPMAPELVKPPLEPSENVEVFVNGPVGDMNPMSAYFTRGMDIEFCRELLLLYSDDEEDDLEYLSHNEPSTSHQRPTINRTSPLVRQQTMGFPRVQCMNNSIQNTVVNSVNNDDQPSSSSSTRIDNHVRRESVNNQQQQHPQQQQRTFGLGQGYAREREMHIQAQRNSYLYPHHPDRQILGVVNILNDEQSEKIYNKRAENDFEYARDNEYHPTIYPKN